MNYLQSLILFKGQSEQNYYLNGFWNSFIHSTFIPWYLKNKHLLSNRNKESGLKTTDIHNFIQCFEADFLLQFTFTILSSTVLSPKPKTEFSMNHRYIIVISFSIYSTHHFRRSRQMHQARGFFKVSFPDKGKDGHSSLWEDKCPPGRHFKPDESPRRGRQGTRAGTGITAQRLECSWGEHWPVRPTTRPWTQQHTPSEWEKNHALNTWTELRFSEGISTPQNWMDV